MDIFEILALLVTTVGVVSFAALITILYLSYANSTVAEYEAGKKDIELIEETICENINSTKSLRRLWKKIKQAAFYVAMAILIPFLVFSVFAKLSTGVLMIGGRGVIAVASGSMSEKNSANPNINKIAACDNQFDTYDIIVLEKIDSPADIGMLDVVAYTNDKGVNIIHRIVDKEYSGGHIRYVTCGDANNANDTYKPTAEDIIGRYTGERVPLIGVFALFLQSYSGIITVMAVIYCLVMIEFINDKILKAQKLRYLTLSGSIDFVEETVHDATLGTRFVETVRFKGYEYVFDESGFVSKSKIDETPAIEGTAPKKKRKSASPDADTKNASCEEVLASDSAGNSVSDETYDPKTQFNREDGES